MKANVIVFEAAAFILFLAFYQGMKRALGKSRGRAFLLGAVLFSLAIETAAAWGGVKNFYWYSINGWFKHYPLGGYIIWLGLVPLAATLLWYMVAGISYLAATTFMAKRGVWAKSSTAGVIAVGFYLIVEPIAVTNHWWTWNVKSFYLIDVPALAWIGVFISVFLFVAAYQLTVMELKDLGPLQRLEDKTVKRLLKTKQPTTKLNWYQLQSVFLARLVVSLAVFAALIAPVMAVLWLVANRGHIPPGW